MKELLAKLSKEHILIVPNNEKEQTLNLLSNNSFFHDFKLLSYKEFESLVSYDFDETTILQISKKYNVNMDVAKIYIENIRYVNKDVYYDSNKLKLLQKIRKENIDLFTPSIIKQAFFKNKTLVAYNLKQHQDKISNLCSQIGVTCDFIDKNNYLTNKTQNIYEFSSSQEEIDFVAHEVATLINNKVDINKIKLCINDADLLFDVFKIFKMYNIAILNNNQTKYLNIPFFYNFLNILKTSNSLDNCFDVFKNTYNETFYFAYYKHLYDVCNLFVHLPFNDFISVFSYYLRTHNFNLHKETNCIEIIDYHTKIKKDEHVFFIGINQGHVPSIKKDEDYLNDNEKEVLHLNNSLKRNALEKERLILFIRSNENIFMSYHNNHSDKATYPSPIIDELKLSMKKIKKDYSTSFSNTYDKLRLASFYDVNFTNSDEYIALEKNYSIDYMQYDNQYKNIKQEKIERYLKEKNIELSYSSLDNFYKCPFKYLLGDILKLNTYDNTFFMDVGTLFHDILAYQDKDGFNVEEYYLHFFENKTELSHKEKFYLSKLKPELDFILKHNKEMLNLSEFKEIICERKFLVDKTPQIKLKVKGFIDKIMCYTQEDKTLVSLIDYKTGTPDIKLDLIDFGLSMQLPMYLYLIKNSELFKNVVVVGFYLQKILQEPCKAYDDEIIQKQNNLKLQGYSLKDFDILSKFDASLQNSQIIKGLKTTKNGSFSKISKLLTTEDMDKIYNIVEGKIKEAAYAIVNGDFYIKPKIIDNKNESCDYCEFKHICYKKANNNVYLSTKKVGDDGE